MGESTVADLGRRARAAAPALSRSSGAIRAEALRVGADLLVARSELLCAANAADQEAAAAEGASQTALDRLGLDASRVEAMAGGLRTVAGLADPVGEVVEGWVRPNGLAVERIRVPLGVVGVIYENRPNVTSDAAGLCVRAGNVAFLRGSATALRSNRVVAGALREALEKVGLPADGVVLVDDVQRSSAIEFMQLRGVIDCLIPRGGPSLLAAILEHATVPYVLDGEGNCHVYVDAAADLVMAEAIVVNAKTQRPGVCNAAESLLVHRDVAAEMLSRLRRAMPDVELRGDERARGLSEGIVAATEEDFATEYLGMVMSVAVVDDLDAAIAHIARYGSGHSEAVVTGDLAVADRFLREVDAAAVLVNASTRFVDGGELGLGAEVGISTQKLHARGPMGLRELTCTKWVVRGTGQVRN